MPFPVKLAVPPLAGLTTSLIAAVYLWSELPVRRRFVVAVQRTV